MGSFIDKGIIIGLNKVGVTVFLIIGCDSIGFNKLGICFLIIIIFFFFGSIFLGFSIINELDFVVCSNSTTLEISEYRYLKKSIIYIRIDFKLNF